VKPLVSAVMWVLVYLLLVAAPLLVMLSGPLPAHDSSGMDRSK